MKKASDNKLILKNLSSKRLRNDSKKAAAEKLKIFSFFKPLFSIKIRFSLAGKRIRPVFTDNELPIE